MTPDVNLHHHLFETTLQKQFFLLAASLKKDKNQFKHANKLQKISKSQFLCKIFNNHTNHMKLGSDTTFSSL